MNTLSKISELVSNLNESNSSKAKQQVLEQFFNNNQDYNTIESIKMIYSPYCTFGITSKVIMSRIIDNQYSIDDIQVETLIELLQKLSNRELTGNVAIRTIRNFIADNSEYSEIILNAIDKDLKTRVGTKIINNVYNKIYGINLIPEFSVALCDKYHECTKYVDFVNEVWYASRKLDGCRCVLRIENGKATAWSRQGRHFETLSILEDEFSNLDIDNVVFDGEICLIDSMGDEDFQSIMKQINRKNHTIDNPHYKIFDMVTIEEFDSQTGRVFEDRQLELHNFINSHRDVIKHASINAQTRVESQQMFDELMNNAIKSNWEGLVIRKNVEYEGKRTRNMLKCKQFNDAEYEVIAIEYGPFQVIENGRAVERIVLSNIIIEHKGYKVSVGSGFSLEQRVHYRKFPEELIGKTVTVQYFEETQNKQGDISLRFPTIKHIYEGERDC